jgi:type VI secretion system protein ImpJ
MQNGFAVEHDAHNSDFDSLELDLDSFKDRLKDGPLNVYLAMATKRSMNTSDEISMFKSLISNPVKDEVSNAVDADIPRLKLVLKLFAGEVPPGMFTSFRLCTVEKNNDVLNLGNFLPPMINLTAAPTLIDEIRKFIETLRAKATFLARQIKGQKDLKKTEDRYFLSQRLHLLVNGLPMLEGIIQSKFISPYSMYLTLCNLLGPLSQIREGSLPPTPPQYDHTSPNDAFKNLLENLNKLVSEVSQDYREIPFIWNNFLFELSLRKEWFGRSIIIGTKGLKNSEAEEWMSSVIIGSKRSITDLKERRVLGSKRRKVLSVDDIGLKSLPGINFFEILTPKDLLEDENRLVISPTSREAVNNKPDSLLLFVKG